MARRAPTAHLDPAHRPRDRHRWLTVLGLAVVITALSPLVMRPLGLLSADPKPEPGTPDQVDPTVFAAAAPAATPPVLLEDAPPVDPGRELATIAGRFVVTLNDVAPIDPAARDAWLAESATPAAAAAITGLLETETADPAVVDLFDTLSSDAPSFVATSPVGWRVQEMTATAAEVMVLASHVIVADGHDTRTWWRTTRVFLTASPTGWRVNAVQLLDALDPHDPHASDFTDSANSFTRYAVAA